MKQKIMRLLLVVLLLATMFALSACSSNEPAKPTRAASIEDIAIQTAPKTNYIVGEPFDVAGGTLALSYDDGSTKSLAFTEAGVHITAPDMNATGSKTITVEYDGFTATYMITVETLKHNITLNLNYEGAPTAAVLTVEDGAFAARPADPSREGFRFLGWYADAKLENEFDFSTSPVTADTTVYAAWAGVSNVTFDLNYENAPEAVVIAVDNGMSVQEVQAPAAIREGYEFAKWHTDATEDSVYDFSSPVEANITLYAHWNEIQSGAEQVSVTFDYNGAADLPARTMFVIAGTTVEKPQDPEVKGRTFTGWFKDSDATESFDFNTAIEADTTLYAGWNVEYYNVSFKYVIDGQETVLRTRKIEPGDRASAGSVPVVDGYKFVSEWYTDPNYTEKFNFKNEVTKDYSLYIKPLKENRFEAEYTVIDNEKTGVGSSDNFSGLKLIFVDNGTAQASNGFWVSGLYYNTAFIEFVVYADQAVENALMSLRLSAEWADMYIAPENMEFNNESYYKYEISAAPALLDEAGQLKKDSKGYTLYDTEAITVFDFSPIAITGAISFAESMVDKRPFTDYLMNDHFALKQGWNVIRLTVANNHAPYDGTMEATAPMVDCMSIYTDVPLSWTPMTENVADPEKLNN